MLRGLFRKLNQVFTGKKLDESLYEELEETLVLSDVSVETTTRILNRLRQGVKQKGIGEVEGAKELLHEQLARLMGSEPAAVKGDGEPPVVWLIVGVNGTGKTTSIGKLAHRFKQAGKKSLLVAADTFRAAAIEQLQIWGQRNGVPVIAHRSGSDPAAVVFDSLQSAKARGYDIVLVDTAGRLHTKHNLMEELAKIGRVVQRELGRAPDETLLVIDATTGQNGLAQAVAFAGAAPLTGIVLTKYDGTAKGGIVITIRDQLDLPVKFVGTGEKIDDLEEFDPKRFVEGLFD